MSQIVNWLLSGQPELETDFCLRPKSVSLEVTDAEKVVAGNRVSAVITTSG